MMFGVPVAHALFSSLIVIGLTSASTAPTVCPDGLSAALATCTSLGTGLSKEACANLGGCLDAENDCRKSPIPSLDDLAGTWQKVSEVYNHPSVEGFWGGIATTANVLSFNSGTFPPLSQGGESAILTVDGRDVAATSARWYPYQVVRNGAAGDLNITSTIRMGFEKNLVLLTINLQNTGKQTLSPNLAIDLSSTWRTEPGTWQWGTPRPNDPQSFSSQGNGSVYLTTDSQSSTSSAFAMSVDPKFANATLAVFSPSINASSSSSITIALAVGSTSSSSTVDAAAAALSNFSSVWDDSVNLWSNRYQIVFEPNNTFFSGSLPVLATEDEQISKLWYHSVISILSTLRTNLLFPRVYATVGPDYGTTIVYAWDTSLWSGLLVLLDPDFLKQQVSTFLEYGVYNGYAVDYISEKLVGPWYSANDVAIFTTMIRYVNMTGDYAWLSDAAAGKSTILAQLEACGTHWQTLENTQFGLADYGGLSNLLEEVVTYTNMVPSLNAANVWMMNELSSLFSSPNFASANSTAAKSYASMADSLATRVLGTYAGPGTGYWLTTYPNGKRQAVKHVYDLDTTAIYLQPYLNSSVKQDMLSFLDKDLYTGPWLRALSLSDLAANVSMRPDHGSNGAYTSWPALAAAAASQLGSYPTLTKYLRSFASVLDESTWAQCYQLIDPLGPAAASAAEATAQRAASAGDFSGNYYGGSNGTAPSGLSNSARVSLPDQGETFNENNGASFGDVVLGYLFGWMPDGKQVVLRDAGVSRGGFEGTLVGVRGPGGGYWTVSAGDGGVSAKAM